MRYTREQLEKLRQSPLVIKPSGLPPAEEWMGPQENARTQSKSDRIRSGDSTSLLDQTNRRLGTERHTSRSSANPEDIILGPPKTSFASATSLRSASRTLGSDDRPSLGRDNDTRDRFSFRKGAEGENEGTRGTRSTTLRPKRIDSEQDSEGWSTVKPRKSFGAEGAERFNGKMGGERHKDDRRLRDRDDRDTRDRPARGFDSLSRDKEADNEQEGTGRRNGYGRARNEPTWFKDNDNTTTGGDRRSNGERFADRTRGWRERDRDDTGGDAQEERAIDRRWDRERRHDRPERVERDPEWMDEPAEEQRRIHTAADFEKWKESMNASSGKTPASEEPPAKELDLSGQNAFFGLEKPKVETPLVIDTGPDKFLSMWSKPDALDTLASKKEGPTKSTTVGKASRFTSFFAPQEDPQRRQTEPPPLLAALAPKASNDQSSKEKEDFARLLQKLQSQSLNTTPPANPASQPKPPPPTQVPQSGPVPYPVNESYRPYPNERPEPHRTNSRESQQAALQDLLNNRSNALSQPSTTRPEQMLHELVNQRQTAISQASTRPDDGNRNAAFLMGLMQNRGPVESIRPEQMMRVPQPPPDQIPDRIKAQMEQQLQREQRERGASQRQQQPNAPPGFFDEALYQRGNQPPHDQPNPNARAQTAPQPTQILPRPPPPGLEQLPQGWGPQNPQLPPPMSQRHIPPPPGLPPAGPGGRGLPMPNNMFPPGFPMPGMSGFPPPPPEGISGAPPRNIPPPPPGFMIPPPGFIPPPNNFQGPEGIAYGGPPFDGRGGPQQQGNFRR